MYLLIILFFISLSLIVFMIRQKIVLQKSSPSEDFTLSQEEVLLEIPHLEKIKDFTIKNLKKSGDMGLVLILRFYIRGSKSLKNKYKEIKNKIRMNYKNNEEKEISKFLKTVGDYKNKIRMMKHQIKEEEKDM